MKKLVFMTALLIASYTLTAQIETPAPSPFSKTEQKVGLTDLSLEYSRPSVKGRSIFGDLVPYDKLWRTGANQYTKLTFSDDVMIAGKEVKAGTYSLFSKPGKTSWELFLYSDIEGGGVPKEWDESKIVAQTTADVYTLPENIETFTITFDDITANSAHLGIMWEKAYVAMKIEVPTDKIVSQSIEKAMSGSPEAGDYL